MGREWAGKSESPFRPTHSRYPESGNADIACSRSSSRCRSTSDAVDAINAAAGSGNDADVVYLALWRLSEHYDLRPPIGTFAIGATRVAACWRRDRYQQRKDLMRDCRRPEVLYDWLESNPDAEHATALLPVDGRRFRPT